MDIEKLELCKENIQPLRKGRKANQLGLALQAEGNAELQARLLNEREKYELAITTYDGDDPLEPRLEYAVWLEQTYIKHGRECNLIPLLEDTITLFKDNPKYKQDPRFIDLVVKYVEAQENAVELFQMVYSQGLGTMCAGLYWSWAEVLEQSGDFKRADQVYQLGIANRAEPVEMLRQGHEQFQLSVGRKMMMSGGDMQQSAAPEELPERQALGKLKKGVGSIRNAHGSAGVLTVKSNKSSTKKQISVFQDSENNYEHLISVALQKNKLASIATSAKNNEENTVKAGTWGKGYNRKEFSRMHSIPITPSFKVHVDPEAETPVLSSKTPSNVLKTRKAELLASSNAMEVFNSTQSAHKPLQANLGVYAGGREFSFEELRAAYYKKKEEIKKAKEEALAQFQTPAKSMIPVQSTPYITGSVQSECETPSESMSKLSIADSMTKSITVKTDGQQDANNYLQGKIYEDACFKTPLRHPAGFAPITPSLNGIDLSEFVETPVQVTQQPLQSNIGAFSIFVDEECASSTSKSSLLPIIEENQETEIKTSPKLIKKCHVRKKQLFYED